jgi:hypothetical protein
VRGIRGAALDTGDLENPPAPERNAGRSDQNPQ